MRVRTGYRKKIFAVAWTIKLRVIAHSGLHSYRSLVSLIRRVAGSVIESHARCRCVRQVGACRRLGIRWFLRCVQMRVFGGRYRILWAATVEKIDYTRSGTWSI